MSGFLFTAVAGTLLHFLFDWTGGNVITALFSAVNESIWEHLKLLFYPMLTVAVVEYCFWGRETDTFWCVKLVGMLVGLALIPVMYYTCTGALGIKADLFNIALFFLAAAVAFWLEIRLFQRRFQCPLGNAVSITVLVVLAVVFTLFTFLPPHIPLFEDPLTDTYGFYGI